MISQEHNGQDHHDGEGEAEQSGDDIENDVIAYDRGTVVVVAS